MILKSLALLILDISSHYSNHPNLPTLSYLGHQFNSIIAIITTINYQLSTITIITNSIQLSQEELDTMLKDDSDAIYR